MTVIASDLQMFKGIKRQSGFLRAIFKTSAGDVALTLLDTIKLARDTEKPWPHTLLRFGDELDDNPAAQKQLRNEMSSAYITITPVRPCYEPPPAP